MMRHIAPAAVLLLIAALIAVCVWAMFQSDVNCFSAGKYVVICAEEPQE